MKPIHAIYDALDSEIECYILKFMHIETECLDGIFIVAVCSNGDLISASIEEFTVADPSFFFKKRPDQRLKHETSS